MSKTKLPKTPPLSPNTKLLSFDLEANGLHGPTFAVGAVLMGYGGVVHSEFTARSPIDGEVDEWVAKHVLPAISDMPITHDSYQDLRDAFWKWYTENEPQADYVLVSNGYPVEYKFLQECQQDNLTERYWQHPYPILDLASLLIQLDEKPAGDIRQNFTPHHPLHDAKVAALTAFRAFEMSGRITN